MSTLTSYTSGTRPPASSNNGLCIFRSDTSAIEVSNGTSWLTYNNDGFSIIPESNSFSGSFDGNGDWIDCNPLTAYQGAASMSISFWWKPNSVGVGPTIGCRNSATNQWGFLATGGINYFLARTGGGTQSITYTAPADTAFHHYLLTYETGTVVLYIDGSNVSYSGGVGSSALHSVSSDFEIGRFSSSFYADGFFDEVALWTAVLNSTNVAQVYNNNSILDLTTNAADYNQASNLTHWWRIGDHASDTSSGGGAVADGNVIGNVENAANPGTNDGTGTAATYSSTTPQ